MGRSKTTTVAERKIPEYVEAGSQQAITRAREIADRPYVEYGGERIAGMDPSERQAYDLASEGTGAYERDLNRSREFAEQAATAFTDFDHEAYMNPYIKGALDPAARELREEMARQQQQIGGQAGMTGAFGGSRQAILESEARRGGTEAIGDLYSRGYAQAFESSRDQINRDRAASARAADQFRATGAQGQQQMTQDIQNLLTTGGLQRNLRQAGLDFDYQQFVEARDWDITNLQPLLAALSSVPYSETQTTTNKSKKSALSTVVGLATTAFGAYTGNVGMMSAGMQGASGGGGGGGGGAVSIAPTGGGFQGIPGFTGGPASVPAYSNAQGTMPGMQWPQANTQGIPTTNYGGAVF